MIETTAQSEKLWVAILNIAILFVIIVFCAAYNASLADFVSFLFAWHAMTGWVRISSGDFPAFNGFPFAVVLMFAYLAFVLVSTWVALDRLVMGNLPLPGVVFIFAFSGLPELVKQSQTPLSTMNNPNEFRS